MQVGLVNLFEVVLCRQLVVCIYYKLYYYGHHAHHDIMSCVAYQYAMIYSSGINICLETL